MKITRIQQSCFRIETDNQIIYFDPFKIPKDSPQADYIFITHSHFDHAQTSSIKRIKKESTKIYCPESSKKIIKKFSAIGVLPNMNYEEDYKFETFPSYNTNKIFHPRKKGFIGYILELEGKKIYHAGDTDLIPEMRDLKAKSLDLIMIPIGGTFTMDLYEAIQATMVISPKNIIPMHEKKISLENFESKLKEKTENIKVISLKPNQSIEF